jgi:hypothetical protein
VWGLSQGAAGTGVDLPPRDICKIPHSGKACGLNGSVQHLLAVYLLEFEFPKFFLEVDLISAQPGARLIESGASRVAKLRRKITHARHQKAVAAVGDGSPSQG